LGDKVMRATVVRLFALRLLGACAAMTLLHACQQYGADAGTNVPTAMASITLDRTADPASVAAAGQQCIALGGSLQQAGRMGRYACYAHYSDGGKSCGDSSECEGGCRATDDTPTGQRARGQCTADSVPFFGCRAEIKNGIVGPYICVD
jgi:hypothetical protein